MAIHNIVKDTWTELTTTTVDTLFSVEKGSIRLQTEDPTGFSSNDGHLIHSGNSIIIPTGLTVYGNSEVGSGIVSQINFGV